MELDITRLFNEIAPRDYSASASEIGQDAGKITWNHALEDAHQYNILDTEEKRDAFRDFVKSSGGWDENEILVFTDTELEALLLQWIASDMREAGITAESNEVDWDRYQRDSEAGQLPGRLFRSFDRIYFNIGE